MNLVDVCGLLGNQRSVYAVAGSKRWIIRVLFRMKQSGLNERRRARHFSTNVGVTIPHPPLHQTFWNRPLLSPCLLFQTRSKRAVYGTREVECRVRLRRPQRNAQLTVFGSMGKKRLTAVALGAGLAAAASLGAGFE